MKNRLLPLFVRDRHDFKIETGQAAPKQTSIIASKTGNRIRSFHFFMLYLSSIPNPRSQITLAKQMCENYHITGHHTIENVVLA